VLVDVCSLLTCLFYPLFSFSLFSVKPRAQWSSDNIFLCVTANWKYRHASLMAISACGEGCHKQMEVILENIVDAVLPFLQDPVSFLSSLLHCKIYSQVLSRPAPWNSHTNGGFINSGWWGKLLLFFSFVFFVLRLFLHSCLKNVYYSCMFSWQLLIAEHFSL